MRPPGCGFGEHVHGAVVGVLPGSGEPGGHRALGYPEETGAVRALARRLMKKHGLLRRGLSANAMYRRAEIQLGSGALRVTPAGSTPRRARRTG